MFIDLRKLEDNQAFQTDVCIVGAGPAGIAIANELIDTGIHVCLVESGDLNADAANQDLADGEMVSHPSHSLKFDRNRQFGGSTNSWAGACAPLSGSDFDAKPWVALDGWPFSKRDLQTYYERAQSMFKLGRYCYEPEQWAFDKIRFLDLDTKTLENRLWQLCRRTNFGEVYRGPFKASKTITVLLNATATEILTDEAASSTEGVRVQTLDGKRSTIKAKMVVLACGAIDNARLLLLSRKHAAAGLGNGHDLVGRYFMQHPHVSAASLQFSGSKSWTKGYKDFKHGEEWLRARFGLSKDAQRRHGVLNAVASPINRHISDSLTHSQSIGYVSLKHILLDLRRGRVPINFASEMIKIVCDIKGITVGAFKHLFNRSGAFYVMGEQFPNPDSRVMLSAERDRLGLERARVDWRLLPIDKQSILVLMQELRSEFQRLGVGEIRLDEWLTIDDHTWPESLAGGHHHMGTTRMSKSPKTGVVDPNARVHGIENLYIAGSSIFPTVGCANPTLTLVATSLKLADHLHMQIKERQAVSMVA